MVSFIDFIIFAIFTGIILVLIGKNSSPDFLTKILYNSDYDESEDESSDSEGSMSKESSHKAPSRKPRKSKGKKPSVQSTNEGDFDSVLDYSSDYELEDFDPSAVADELIDNIKRG